MRNPDVGGKGLLQGGGDIRPDIAEGGTTVDTALVTHSVVSLPYCALGLTS